MQSKQKEQLPGLCALFLSSEIVIRTNGCSNQEGRVCRESAEDVVAVRKLGQPKGTTDAENL
jgi:hypothetical protein